MATYRLNTEPGPRLLAQRRRQALLLLLFAAAACTPVIFGKDALPLGVFATVLALFVGAALYRTAMTIRTLQAGGNTFELTVASGFVRRFQLGAKPRPGSLTTMLSRWPFLAPALLALGAALAAFQLADRWSPSLYGLAIVAALLTVIALLGTSSLRQRSAAPPVLELKRAEITGFTRTASGLVIRTADPTRSILVPAELVGYDALTAQLRAMDLPELPPDGTLGGAAKKSRPRTAVVWLRAALVVAAGELLVKWNRNHRLTRKDALDLIPVLAMWAALEQVAYYWRRSRARESAAQSPPTQPAALDQAEP